MKKFCLLSVVSVFVLTACPRPPQNRAPVADPVTLQTTSGNHLEQELTADDPDGDALTFLLLSSASGTGYTGAALDPNSGELSVDVTAGFTGTIVLEFRVSDGSLLSATAEVTIEVSASNQNHAPVANPVSLQTAADVPYIEQYVSATDADNDGLTYELLSPYSGAGYSEALLAGLTGQLFVTIQPGFEGQILLSYRATDGQLFSNNAQISIEVTAGQTEDRGTGSADVDAHDYAGYAVEYYDAVPGVDPSGETRQVRSIDLSPSFPAPGNQGSQGSCVGWATAYALKSYHEKLEVGWALNGTSRVFSPAYVFNQIHLPDCNGSYISEALDLIVNQGCATWATMPYSDAGCGLAPNATQRNEATNFRAGRWYRLNSVLEAKDALTNRDPVVIGIPVYNNFNFLSGTGSVYNTAQGNSQGGHAVTIVGFDDDQFGGAFRVINSWGTSWGDEGFFWMPYEFAAQIINQMYVMIDAPNVSEPEHDDPIRPDRPDLPNLQIAGWLTNYDAQAGGQGILQYEVVNTGTGTAAAGFDINFMLSTDATISSTDTYLLWEECPFDLATGNTAYRDQTNQISYTFPEWLQTGTYYLALWVDDLEEVRETDENDNVALAEDTMTIQNFSADLIVDYWYFDWDIYGDAALVYSITNQGSAGIGTDTWDISVVYTPDLVVGDNNDMLVFQETGFALQSGQSLFRDDTGPAYFNVLEQWNGDPVPVGAYYVVFWVDAYDIIAESDDQNNASWSQGVLEITPKSQDGRAVIEPGEAYNGRLLRTPGMLVKKVEVVKSGDGQVSLQVLEEGVHNPKSGLKDVGIYRKVNESADKVVFPKVERRAMP
ncbi:MAG: hypothetical protein HYV26_06220 [Candidatus Hydrogenedentes bacterium]|nr:hypothetical protein [Candidatus Hydrogenedentota bacterium]